jgi:hypothetical protein
MLISVLGESGLRLIVIILLRLFLYKVYIIILTENVINVIIIIILTEKD